MIGRRAVGRTAVLFAGLATAGAALAESQADANEFCRRVGRNHMIFEMLLETSNAEALPAPGTMRCTWSFSGIGTPAGRAEITVTLESRLLASETAARQAILLARLPENNRGKTVEPLPRMGDDGIYRTTAENGTTRLVEIEATKGRRHFLLTVRPRAGQDVNHRVVGASIEFLGVGLSAL